MSREDIVKIYKENLENEPQASQVMNKVDFSNLIDEFYDANAILEVCRGYTQADIPDMKALDAVLWNLEKTYGQIYKQLCDSNKEDTTSRRGDYDSAKYKGEMHG